MASKRLPQTIPGRAPTSSSTPASNDGGAGGSARNGGGSSGIMNQPTPVPTATISPIELPTLDTGSVTNMSGKGGGALRSIDQKFQVNHSNGTCSLSIPLPVTQGRNGFQPALSLSYDSGSGNGPFGIGWNLGVARIERKTSSGVPSYTNDDGEDADIFVFSGMEDLVPVREGAQPVKGCCEGFQIHKYRPRVEQEYKLRIERWKNMADSDDVHWRTITGDNAVSIYGRDDSSRVFESRNSDVGETRVFAWLLCEAHDVHGNAAAYEYKSENEEGFNDLESHQRAFESARDAGAQTRARYLKSIRYGNRTPCRNPKSWNISSLSALKPADWCFSLVFDYGEHDQAAPMSTGTTPWPVRADAFSSCRSGFEIRTYRLCRRALMFHHFPKELLRDDYLVSSTAFTFKETSTGSFLTSVVQNGHVFDPATNQFTSESLAPQTFSYSEMTDLAGVQREEIQPTCLQSLPVSRPGAVTRWLDLDGEGMPGLLVQLEGAWYFQRNESAISPGSGGDADCSGESESESNSEVGTGPTDGFGPIQQLPFIPNFQDYMQQSFEDLDGNGLLDMVSFDLQGRPLGYRERLTDAEGGWTPYQQFPSVLNKSLSDNKVKRMDLTGDGLGDLLLASDVLGDLTWHQSLGKGGFSGPSRCQKIGPEPPQRLIGDDYAAVYLADMSGDGLQDIVEISNGRVTYWPNYGRGRFGSAITMVASPFLGDAGQFSFERVHLVDIDGSGTSDLLYLLPLGGALVYLNQCGNAWSNAVQVPQFPRLDKLSSIFTLDLLGKGTTCLCWIGPKGSALGELVIQYLDLATGGKPHLLTSVDNGLGTQTRVSYRPSTHFYLRDERAGRSWQTKLPSIIHVVSRTVERDQFASRKITTKYAYHDGFFDPREREFRGFGMVESWVHEEIQLSSAAAGRSCAKRPVNFTKMWFHTGAAEASLIPERTFGRPRVSTVLPDISDSPTLLEASRALKGLQFRVEVYGLDGSPRAEVPYSVQEHTFDLLFLQQPQNSKQPGIARVTPRETVSLSYERDESNPRKEQEMVLERDNFGGVKRKLSIQHGCNQSTLQDPMQKNAQESSHAVYTETTYTNHFNTDTIFQTPRVASTKTQHIINFRTVELVSIDAVRKGAVAFLAQMSAVDNTKPVCVVRGKESRAYYRNAAMTDCLSLGQIECFSIIDRKFDLAVTKEGCSAAYGSSEQNLMGQSLKSLMESGGHVDLDRDGCWWAQSSLIIFKEPSRTESELACARRAFFTPMTTTDPFGNASHVKMDRHFLLAEEATDPLGNITRVTNDYRSMKPTEVKDANGNRTASALDVWKDTVAVARMGKASDLVGDRPDERLSLVMSDAELTMFFEKPSLTSIKTLLGSWTARTIISRRKMQVQGRTLPPFLLTIQRSEHAFRQGTTNPDAGDLLVNVTYLDERRATLQHSSITSWDGDVPQSWIVAGCAVYDTSGRVVKTHQAFIASHGLYIPLEEVATPASFIFSDALGRSTGQLHPDHTWSKTILTAWSQTEVGEGGTINIEDPRLDPDVGLHFRALSSKDFLPTSLQMQKSSTTPQDQAGAEKSMIYAGTCSASHHASSGQTILHLDGMGSRTNRSLTFKHDVHGNVIAEGDSIGRTVHQNQFNMLGHCISSQNMDAGEKRTVYDCLGQLLLVCVNNDMYTRNVYDALRRPIEVWVKSKDDTTSKEVLWCKTVYGESMDAPETRNLRGRIYRDLDQSGEVAIDGYDFKGLATGKAFRPATDHKSILDWTLQNALDKPFYSFAEYDALDRAVLSTDALGQQTRYAYDLSGRVQRVESRSSDGAWIPYITSSEYTADGLAERIRYGNKSTTRYTYDPHSRHLVTKKTTCDDRSVHEDIFYMYDALSRLVWSKDSAQPVEYFRGSKVDPAHDYSYDVLGRLIRASGREMISARDNECITNPSGTKKFTPFDHQLVNYVETYQYDAADNLTQVQHQFADISIPGWTKKLEYEERSQIQNAKAGNRLSRIVGGKVTETYRYDGAAGRMGCITSMPGYSHLEWDVFGKLKCISQQSVADPKIDPGMTWCTYNKDGERTRKVTERLGGGIKLKETLFLDGAEIYIKYAGDGTTPKAETHTSRISSGSGSAPLVMLEKETDKPLLTRYTLSSNLEVDDKARLVSYEEYTAFAVSVLTTRRSDVEAPAQYRFASYRRDTETGFSACGARYYVPWIGRWLSADPLGTSDGLNVFAYCSNDPINHTDPRGTMKSDRNTQEYAAIPNPLPLQPSGSARDWFCENGVAAVKYLGKESANGVSSTAANAWANTALTAAIAMEKSNPDVLWLSFKFYGFATGFIILWNSVVHLFHWALRGFPRPDKFVTKSEITEVKGDLEKEIDKLKAEVSNRKAENEAVSAELATEKNERKKDNAINEKKDAINEQKVAIYEKRLGNLESQLKDLYAHLSPKRPEDASRTFFKSAPELRHISIRAPEDHDPRGQPQVAGVQQCEPRRKKAH